jgi:iron complex transport system substrate-binding protein
MKRGAKFLKVRSCFKVISILIILTVVITGCGMQAKQTVPTKEAQAGYLAVKDDAGRSITLQHKPEKIVVLAPSFLELLYAVGGKAVGRPSSTSKTALTQQAMDIPEVGFVYNINIEKVVSLQPDLVIAMQGTHDKLLPVLESNHIPVIVLKYKTYDDVFDKISLFGDIAGTKDKAQTLTQGMNAKLKVITDKLPDKTTKIAILHATAKSVSLELDNSIAGNTAKLLRLQNVAASSKPIDTGSDATPYSLEKLVESDPDLIFVVTMGNATEIEKTMRDDVESNPAWSTLRAVRDKKLVFLPSDLFLLNPGLRMPEAAEYMARLVYPEIYAK